VRSIDSAQVSTAAKIKGWLATKSSHQGKCRRPQTSLVTSGNDINVQGVLSNHSSGPGVIKLTFGLVTGAPSEHNFWTSRVNPIKNYIFGILRLRAID